MRRLWIGACVALSSGITTTKKHVERKETHEGDNGHSWKEGKGHGEAAHSRTTVAALDQ